MRGSAEKLLRTALAGSRVTRGGLDLVFDRAQGVGRDVNKLHTYADLGEAVANLATGMDQNARKGKTEADVENSAFGEDATCVDEHAARGNVGRTGDDVVAFAFVGDGQLAQARITRSEARGGPGNCRGLPIGGGTVAVMAIAAVARVIRAAVSG